MMKQQTIDVVTTDKFMKVFHLARVHKTYDPDENYELLEFRGDLSLNMAVGEYIVYRWPKYVNVGYITKIKHHLVSGKVLGILAYKAGFEEFALYGDEVKELIKQDSNPETNLKYRAILEDMVEAFCGALYKVCLDVYGNPVAWECVRKFVWSFLEEEKIDVSWTIIYDAKTRFKELCTSMGWGDINRHLTVKYDRNKDIYNCKIVGYPMGNKTPFLKNMVELAKGSGKDSSMVQKSVSSEALRELSDKYGISEKVPNPYKR